MQENNIFPFLWMRGESEEVIRTEMEKISESNIRAVCLEARPHPDFAGEGWWHDVDIVLDEAKKRGMKIWILDDAHFPTGQANGLLPEKYPERARRYLYTQFVETTGPLPCAQVDVELLTKKQFTWMDFGKPQVKPVLDEKRVLSVTAYRVIEGDVLSEEGTDLTGKVKDGILTWDVPEGTWQIFVNFMTTDFGARPEYINYIDEDSVRLLIESVYEAHYKHYKDEFGKTILGFFSDEPGFYNTDDLKMDDKIGEKMMPLPWCGELEKKMETVCGAGWKQKIPYLWYKDEGGKCAALRFHYMDCVSRLYEKNFSRQIGEWCRSHGVQYIGHVIEDNGQHTRLGCGAGHYFRAMAGQDMAGIDNIGNQIVPGNPDSTRHNPSGAGDSQFFHFGLAKLGASEAWIDPKKKGRLMCENFGAYGWGLGIKNMKWLVDYLVAQGVNRFVPHAFSMADYPDDDCPPHYYARGNNPQFPFFGELMKYTDRLCSIFSGGQNVPQAAVLYEAEGDWAGKAMRSYAPGRKLQEHQIDYEILPADVFEDVEYYGTRVEDGNLVVNGRVMKVLIIPEMEYLSEKVFRFLSANPDLTTVFINSRPKEVIGAGEAREIGLLQRYPVISLEELAGWLKQKGVSDVIPEKECRNLVVYHYKKEQDIYFFFNTSLSAEIRERVTLPASGTYGEYRALEDTWYEVPRNGNSFELLLKPYESMILVVDPERNLRKKPGGNIVDETDISSGWELTLYETGKSGEGEKEELNTLLPVSERHRDFSGIMEYRKQVSLKKEHCRIVLEPQYVYECMEVIVNGEDVGKKICPPYAADITDAVRDGENEIVIRVVNTLIRNANTKPGIFGPERAVLEPSGMFGHILLIKKTEN